MPTPDVSRDAAQVAPPASEAGRVGSAYIHGLETVLGGNDGVLTLQLREPLDPARVARAYERQLRARPTLRLKYVEDAATRRHRWLPFDADEFESRLARELDELTRFASHADVMRYDPTNVRLPFRLLLRDELTLVARISHVLANGSAEVFWLDDWFGFYERDDDAIPPLPTSRVPRRSGLRRLLAGVAGLTRGAAFALAFRWRAGRRPATQTLDLAARTPQPERRIEGYTVARAILSPEETSRVVAASKARAWSVTAHLIEAVAQVVFAARSEGRRLTIALPTDMSRQLADVAPGSPGNTTGNMVLQLFRDRSLEPRIRADLISVQRGVSYWMTRVLDLFLRDEFALKRALARDALRPMAERDAYESISCGVSNMGRHPELARLERACAWMSMFTRAPTPIFAVVTVAGTMTIEMASPDGLCDPSEMIALLTAIPAQLGVEARIEIPGDEPRS